MFLTVNQPSRQGPHLALFLFQLLLLASKTSLPVSCAFFLSFNLAAKVIRYTSLLLRANLLKPTQLSHKSLCFPLTGFGCRLPRVTIVLALSIFLLIAPALLLQPPCESLGLLPVALILRPHFFPLLQLGLQFPHLVA